MKKGPQGHVYTPIGLLRHGEIKGVEDFLAQRGGDGYDYGGGGSFVVLGNNPVKETTGCEGHAPGSAVEAEGGFGFTGLGLHLVLQCGSLLSGERGDGIDE